MCVTCGCGKPHERHGDQRNIIMEDLQRAAEASDITVDKAIENIKQAVEMSGTQRP